MTLQVRTQKLIAWLGNQNRPGPLREPNGCSELLGYR
jgi:hypothetical protein